MSANLALGRGHKVKSGRSYCHQATEAEFLGVAGESFVQHSIVPMEVRGAVTVLQRALACCVGKPCCKELNAPIQVSLETLECRGIPEHRATRSLAAAYVCGSCSSADYDAVYQRRNGSPRQLLTMTL